MRLNRRHFLFLASPAPTEAAGTTPSPSTTRNVERGRWAARLAKGIGQARLAIALWRERLARRQALWSSVVAPWVNSAPERLHLPARIQDWQTVARRWTAVQSWVRRPNPVQVLIAGVILAVIGVTLAVVLLSAYLTRDLPPVDQIFSGEMFQTALVYDRKGRVLDEIIDPNGGRRDVVPLQAIPRTLIDATVMTEDPSFFANSGVDATAIVRAFVQDLRSGHVVSGASTITEQLVKNVLMTPEEQRAQSVQRKLGEAILAYRVTQRYSKDEILQRYLNEINYGNLAYGSAAASETYFGKPVQQLDLAQSALLAGLPAGPALFDPYQHPDAAKQRQLEVLALMVKHGGISQTEADAAAREPLPYHSLPRETQAPHFVVDVRSLLDQRFSRAQIYQSGLRVYTTLDLDLQDQLEQIVQTQRPALASAGADNAAVVVLDARTGEVLAMVGSADFASDAIQGQVNLATAPREPGATVMPFTYLQAFDQRLAMPATALLDAPIKYSMGAGAPPYQPQDADGTFRGMVSARFALANSLNVPAIGLLDRIGVADLLTVLRRAGLASLAESPDYYGLALTLGDGPVTLLDLVRAYGVLANGGGQIGDTASADAVAPIEILKATDANGTILEASQSATVDRLASPQAAWLVTDVLADPSARAKRYGANSPLTLPDRPAAVDAGTTPNRRDSWVIGYTPGVVVGVWVGNTDGSPMTTAATTETATLWQQAIEAALNGQPVEPFTPPPGLTRAAVDAATGLLPVPGRPTVLDWFMDGTLPTTHAPSLPILLPRAPAGLVVPISQPAEPVPVSPAHAPVPPPKPAPPKGGHRGPGRNGGG